MDQLFKSRLSRPLKITSVVIDNVYENPYDIREYALKQEYVNNVYHPGVRTADQASAEINDFIKKIFLCYNLDVVSTKNAFQHNLSDEWSWIHQDSSIATATETYACIVYLTPNAPINSGTSMLKYIDGTMDNIDAELLGNKRQITLDNTTLNKWKHVNKVGNIFNRLIIYDSSNYHSSREYFGNNIQDARLMQLIFIHANPVKI